MAKRVVTGLGAAFLGCLVSCFSTYVAAAPAEAEDAAASGACLANPKGTAPKGERWYYRVERGTKRHCWYTRAATPRNVAEQSAPSRPAPADVAETAPAQAAPPPAPVSPAPLQPAVANARAELARATNPVASSPPPFPPAAAAAPVNDKFAAAEPPAEAPSTTLADRWADHPNAGQPNPAYQPAAPAPADLAPPPSRATSAPAANAESTPLWILLSVIGGVLALVGIVTALIKTFAGAARYTRPAGGWSTSRWQENFDAEPPMAAVDDAPVMQMDVPPMNWVRIARETSDQRSDEIEQLLSRRARPAI